MKEREGTKDNFTHIRFYYGKGYKMTLNKWTYEHIYPNEELNADVEKIEYLIKVD